MDIFTDVPLQGNQLAVFTDARGLTTEEIQALARKMNFSETVFVLPPTRATPLAESGGQGDARRPMRRRPSLCPR